jgi:glycosyltransferase involved in cell wall biosynthesis
LYLNYKNLSFSIVVFGQSEPSEKSIINYPIKYMGTLNDDLTLALLYSASDMLLVPSRIESFCQTASESQSCGTPVVGFNTTGLRSTVKHLETGYLAEAFDIVDFARGILWVLEQDSTVLSNNARSFASENFDLKVVGKSHINLYNKILGL